MMPPRGIWCKFPTVTLTLTYGFAVDAVKQEAGENAPVTGPDGDAKKVYNKIRNSCVRESFLKGLLLNQIDADYVNLYLNCVCEKFPEASLFNVRADLGAKLRAVRKACVKKFRDVRMVDAVQDF